MTAVLLLLGAALAATPAGTLWTRTGLSGRPDLLGRTSMRAEQQLGGVVPMGHGFSLTGLGSVRDPSAVGAPLTGDLLLLHGTWAGGTTRVEAGRFVSLDPRGAQHLDGARVDTRAGALGARAWAGRRWHPETWRAGRTVVGGAALLGRVGPGTHAEAGVEGRTAPAGRDQGRVHGALSRRGARGQSVHLLAEAAAGHDPGQRARLSGELPLRALRLGGGLRWEGLTEDLLPVAIDSPMAWLAPQGYAAADARALHQRGDRVLDIRGGPVWHPGQPADQRLGGTGRVGIGHRPRSGGSAGLTGVGAGLGDAALAGAVLDAGVRREGRGLIADLGCFRMLPTTGPAVTTWEARASGFVPVPVWRPEAGLRLRTELATGVDRVLAPFVRGGLVLEGAVGLPAGGRP